MSGWLEGELRQLLAMGSSEQQAVLAALSAGRPLAGSHEGGPEPSAWSGGDHPAGPAAGPGRQPPESDGGLQQAPMKVPLPADRGSALVPQEGLYAGPMCQQPRGAPRALPLQHGEDDCSQLVQSITSAMSRVLLDASARGQPLQQTAGTSEQQAWTGILSTAPAAAGPQMHGRQHAAGWWAAGAPWQQSQPPIAGLSPLTSSRRGPSSGADAAAPPVGAGSNRKADRLLTKSTKAAGSTPQSGKVTTVMVRNLPPTLKRQDFLRELDATGFENTYDFCYLPRDFSSGWCHGHAFVNFKEAADASQFRVVWHKTERFGRRDPLVDVSPARIQGYEANAREANSSRGRCKVWNPNFRSLIKGTVAGRVEPPPPPRGSSCSADLGTPEGDAA